MTTAEPDYKLLYEQALSKTDFTGPIISEYHGPVITEINGPKFRIIFGGRWAKFSSVQTDLGWKTEATGPIAILISEVNGPFLLVRVGQGILKRRSLGQNLLQSDPDLSIQEI